MLGRVLAVFLLATVFGCQESSKPLGRDQRGGTILGDQASTDATGDASRSDRKVPNRERTPAVEATTEPTVTASPAPSKEKRVLTPQERLQREGKRKHQ